MSDWPAYMRRPTLLAYLDIADRTLDAWLAKGFPKSKKPVGQEPRWKRAEVDAYMDGRGREEVASPRRDPHQEVRDATAAFLTAKH